MKYHHNIQLTTENWIYCKFLRKIFKRFQQIEQLKLLQLNILKFCKIHFVNLSTICVHRIVFIAIEARTKYSKLSNKRNLKWWALRWPFFPSSDSVKLIFADSCLIFYSIDLEQSGARTLSMLRNSKEFGFLTIDSFEWTVSKVGKICSIQTKLFILR